MCFRGSIARGGGREGNCLETRLPAASIGIMETRLPAASIGIMETRLPAASIERLACDYISALDAAGSRVSKKPRRQSPVAKSNTYADLGDG